MSERDEGYELFLLACMRGGVCLGDGMTIVCDVKEVSYIA